MMASMALDGEVRRSLLDRNEAEKAFRPWWDTLEDTLLNTLIALGQSCHNFLPEVAKIFLMNIVKNQRSCL